MVATLAMAAAVPALTAGPILGPGGEIVTHAVTIVVHIVLASAALTAAAIPGSQQVADAVTVFIHKAATHAGALPGTAAVAAAIIMWEMSR